MVKSCGFVRRSFTQVPFANYGSLIAMTFKVLGYIWQSIVNAISQGPYTIDVIECASQNCCAARRAYGVTHIAMIQPHSLSSQPINAGGLIDPMSVTADGFGSMIISHDEQNIGVFIHTISSSTSEPASSS